MLLTCDTIVSWCIDQCAPQTSSSTAMRSCKCSSACRVRGGSRIWSGGRAMRIARIRVRSATRQILRGGDPPGRGAKEILRLMRWRKRSTMKRSSKRAYTHRDSPRYSQRGLPPPSARLQGLAGERPGRRGWLLDE